MLHWQTSHITITILILPEYSNDFSQKNINTITLQSDITIHKLQFVHNLPSCNEKKSLGTYIICSIQIAIYSLVQNWFQPCIFCVCISYHYFFGYTMISFVILLSKTMKAKTKYEHNISWIYAVFIKQQCTYNFWLIWWLNFSKFNLVPLYPSEKCMVLYISLSIWSTA